MDYKGKRWKRTRAAVLARDNYICQISKRYGRIRQADTVHHILPADEYPAYRYDARNLISLAGDVHDRLHDRTTGRLTAEGMELARRTCRRNGWAAELDRLESEIESEK